MFETASDFSLHIETLANQKNIGVVDALLEYCNENFIETMLRIFCHATKLNGETKTNGY